MYFYFLNKNKTYWNKYYNIFLCLEHKYYYWFDVLSDIFQHQVRPRLTTRIRKSFPSKFWADKWGISKSCRRVLTVSIWLLRGWGRCLKVTLQTCVPKNCGHVNHAQTWGWGFYFDDVCKNLKSKSRFSLFHQSYLNEYFDSFWKGIFIIFKNMNEMI